MMTQRDAFWDEIYNLAKIDRDIVVISADMGAPSLDKFRRDLPQQFINTGIAEQNSILIASGLAKEGKKVFVYAIASFLTLNCIEKIRVQCGMMNIPINIVGVGAGFSYPDSGPTHHLCEDIAIMRSIPNITTISITDHHMATKAAREYKSYNHTQYIRLERQPIGTIHHKADDVDLNKGLIHVKKGNSRLVISNGNLTFKCLDIINNRQLDIGLVDLFKFPINSKELLNVVNQYKEIICIEENFLPGAIGSAVLEVLSDNKVQIPVKRVGIDIAKGYCYQYGGREEIHKHYGLDIENLEKIITKEL